MKHTLNVAGADYNIVAAVKTETGLKVPVVDIPIMSDDTWNKLANAQHNQELLKEYGYK